MSDSGKLNVMCGAAKATGLGTKLLAFKTAILNMCLSTAGLTIGSTSPKAVRLNSTDTAFLNDGVFKSKAAVEVAFTATTHDIPANAASVQEACYLVQLAADGTPSLVMGPIATGAGNAVVPGTESGKTPVGYLRLAVAAGATKFDATTDDLSAEHLTDTYVNFAFNLPATLTAL